MVNKRFLYRFKGMALLLSASLFAINGYAQCGSSGDPIVNITFGTVDDPDFGDGTTTYDSIPRNQSPQGEGWYKLVPDINDGLRSWHNLRDHTGDAGGLMIVFNADDYPGEFYRIRLPPLCENTRFRFSAWIANANRDTECINWGGPIPPNVRFVIEDMDGNQVNSADDVTGDIRATSSPQWLEYGFEFDTGNQTEFYLVLINDNPGGCGNDLAIDDIQFTPCGPPISLTMDETLKQADTLFFCEETPTPIVLTGSIAADDSYATEPVFQWQTRSDDQANWTDMDGERDEELTVMPIHNQWYRLTAAASATNLDEPLCRISSEPVRIAQLAPQADATGTSTMDPICENGSIFLDPPEYTGANVGPVTYQWLVDAGNGWADVPGALAAGNEFQVGEAGVVRMRRQAINLCDDRFVTHTFEIEVQETIRTTFTLPQPELCADDSPLPLSGGEIVNGDMVGVYTGRGVIDNVFYPAVAGVGPQTITFSPPSDVFCQQPSQATITVYDTVYIEPMLDVIMLQGQTATLRPQTNATQFSWSDEPGLDNYNVQNPVASPNQTTTYTLTASNAVGCGTEESVTITVLTNLTIPNSFTPNGDNVNDTWAINGLINYPNAFLQVFNRWGALVFSSRGYATPWNGQHNGASLPTGTYYYTLSSDILLQPLSGSVSILR